MKESWINLQQPLEEASIAARKPVGACHMVGWGQHAHLGLLLIKLLESVALIDQPARNDVLELPNLF
jgi:hypothetical protein